MSRDTAETVEVLTTSLRSVSKSMTGVLGHAEATSDAKLTAMMLSLSMGAAADLLEKLQKSDVELRSAIQAAVESLEAVPEAASTKAMLSAALVEVES